MNAATPHFDDHALIEVLPHGLMFFLDSTYSHKVRKKTVCAAQLNKQLLQFKLYKQLLQAKLCNAAYWIVLLFRQSLLTSGDAYMIRVVEKGCHHR